MKPYKGTKKFVAVEFSDDSHSIIPQKWVFAKKKTLQCYWPPKSISRDIDCEPEEEWPSCQVTKIIAESSKDIDLVLHTF